MCFLKIHDHVGIFLWALDIIQCEDVAPLLGQSLCYCKEKGLPFLQNSQFHVLPKILKTDAKIQDKFVKYIWRKA